MAEVKDQPTQEETARIQHTNNAALMGDTTATFREDHSAKKTVMIVGEDGQVTFQTVDAIVTQSNGAGASYNAMSQKLARQREAEELASIQKNRDIVAQRVLSGNSRDVDKDRAEIAALNKRLGKAHDTMAG